MTELLYYLEGEDGRHHVLPELPCEVGRGIECGLPMDFDRISRRHARFARDAETITLTDLSSTNGTFVNHERIDSPTPVKPGDAVHFANHAFVLRSQQPTGSTTGPTAAPHRRNDSDTVLGFTAVPTGFPVQAPEFFELLNAQQVTGTCQPVRSVGGSLYAHTLRIRGTHPRLAVDSPTLFRLAEQLGEEARLAQLVRKTCLAQARTARLSTTLLVEVHPAECEDGDDLADGLLALAREFRELDLVIEIPLARLRHFRVKHLHRQLNSLNSGLCGQITASFDPAALTELGPCLDYLRLPASAGPQRARQYATVLAGTTRLLIDGVDDLAVTERFQAISALLQGMAIGRIRDISGSTLAEGWARS